MTTATTPEPGLSFHWKKGDDPFCLASREWLVTNGLGGYASGTVMGIATRRYHGAFVPNLPAPRGRTVLVPFLEETLVAGNKRARISGAEYANGSLGVDTTQVLAEYGIDWQVPFWKFDFEGRRFEKRLAMPYCQNSTYIEYKLVSGEAIDLEIRPGLSCRMHEGPLGFAANWPFTLNVSRNRFEFQAFEGAPVLRMAVRPGRTEFVIDPRKLDEVMLRQELQRGHDHLDRVHSPGRFRVRIEPGESAWFLASTEQWESLESDAGAIFDAERKRGEKLLAQAPRAAADTFGAQLTLAADQFIVLPWSRSEETVLFRASGEPVRTVIAGYHWFTDWGRDTMISLEGLTLCTGRHYEARAILRTFARYVKDGLLPNLFPEGQRTGVYNTADATLWFFHAIDRYYQTTADRDTLETLFPTLRDIIEHHMRGTHYGIYVDPRDGLLRAASEGFQLTWMDAKVDEWVVTPRRGKPVEIQALWFNALRLMAIWAKELGEPGELYSDMAKRAHESFNARFWNESGKHLYDVIDGERGCDASFRPNQIFTLSLRYSILDRSYWKPVVDSVRDRLLTPFGLRTLAPGSADYHALYEGDRWARDAAYHQGMVWAWLIGPFINAWLRVYRDRREARRMLGSFESHLREAGLGTISEIFDSEKPYTPRGCVAQAWSVAEVLRTWLLTAEVETPVASLTKSKQKEDADEASDEFRSSPPSSPD